MENFLLKLQEVPSGNGQTSTGHLYLGATSDGSRDLNGQIAFLEFIEKF